MSLSFEVEQPPAWGIIRLLSGPLRGCEYRLADVVTLVVTGDVTTLMGGAQALEIPEFPENSIVIPMEGGCNFEIIRDENLREGCRLRILGDVTEERICYYQDECSVALLSFAIRLDGMEWNHSLDAEQSLSQRPVTKVEPRARWSRIIPVLLCALVLLCVIGLGFVLLKKFGENKRVAEVSAVIDGSAEPYRLAHGRDGVVYVFAESERDASWARQVLTREKMHKSARVATVKEEEARLDRLLLEKYPKLAFYRLKLADPMTPTLLLSKERSQLDDKEDREVTASLMEWMPYAEKIGKAIWSDSLLDERAKAGLDRMRVDYDRSDSGESVTYRVQGDLSDSELASLQGFIDVFYRDFGTRYIYFSVVLKEDWLKGKSFKYGGSGYVKMAPQHWFFSFKY